MPCTAFLHAKACFFGPIRIDLVKKEARRSVLLLSMGYKKDIFGSFAHEFELSQKMIYHLWRYDIRRCRMIYLLHKRDIISVPSYAIGIYHPPKVDIISKIYHPFRKERISLKNDKFRKKLVVFLGGEREIRTLAPVTRPTPLAGAPLHLLEYFSVNCSLNKYRS